ncbi:MAG: retropepsin-like aspartic protease [Methanosarcinales archaeon]
MTGLKKYLNLEIYIKEMGLLKDYRFLVDSGASISVASRDLAERIGLKWEYGIKTILQGISKKKTCEIEGRIHEVEVYIPDANLTIRIPICFAVGDAPLILGREGFFDYFMVLLDKEAKKTYFELQESVKNLLFPEYEVEEPRFIYSADGSKKYVLIDYEQYKEYQKLLSCQNLFYFLYFSL